MDALRKRQATILLVEDRSLSRQNVARFFDISGYEVYQAENGEDAIVLLSCTKFDVVISDLNLPGQITGLDILSKHRRTRSSDGGAILVSSCGSDEVRAQAKALGAVYLEKPIFLTKLEKTASSLCDSHYVEHHRQRRILCLKNGSPEEKRSKERLMLLQ